MRVPFATPSQDQYFVILILVRFESDESSEVNEDTFGAAQRYGICENHVRSATRPLEYFFFGFAPT